MTHINIKPWERLGAGKIEYPPAYETGTAVYPQTGTFYAHTMPPQGWQCPECKHVYAPHVDECKRCPGKHFVSSSSGTTTTTWMNCPECGKVKVVFGVWDHPDDELCDCDD